MLILTRWQNISVPVKIEIETPFDEPIVEECEFSVSSSWFAPLV